MCTSRLSLLAVFCSPVLILVQAWAPATHPDPSKLPKALDFAEKAWKFPRADKLHYPISPPRQTSEEEQNRRHPWSSEPSTNVQDQSLSCMEDGDQFYFDGHSTVSLKWPTRQAFLASLPKPNLFHLAVNEDKNDEEDCDDFYYDDSGDALCWATTMGTAMASAAVTDESENNPLLVVQNDEEEECEYTYFDRIGGEELCWLSFAQTAAAAHKEMTQHPGHPVVDDDCENTYYDDTGDLLCWAI